MRSVLRGLALLASFGQINCLTRFNVNNNEKDSVTFPCSSDGAEQIATNTLVLVQWFRTQAGPHGPIPDSKVKILEGRPDPTDVNNFEKSPDLYSADLTSGALTLLKGNNGGKIGFDDQALFECRMTLGNDIAVDEATILVIVSQPPEDERDPAIIDRQPTQSSDGEENVFNQDFVGNLATCQSGHANPEPRIKWHVRSKSGEESFIEGTSGLLSTNPVIGDDDETDQLHEIELPLSLYGQGEMSKYHESTFTCIVTYDVANEQGRLEEEHRSTVFGTIKIKHPVSQVTLMVNGKEISNGIVDLTYDTEFKMSCDSDGYPEPTRTLSEEDVSAALQQIKDANTGANIAVTCTAKNDLTKKAVSETVELEPSYISDVTCDWALGPRSKDKDMVICTATGSEDPEIKIYAPTKDDKSDDATGNNGAIAHGLIETLETREPLCESNSCEVKAIPAIFAVARIPGKDTAKVLYHFEAGTTRSNPELVIHETGVPFWSHEPNADVMDAAKIRFWRTTESGKPQFDEITGNTEENGVDYPSDGQTEADANANPANSIARHIPKPAGGKYVVCYDVKDDVAGDVSGCDGDTFKQCAASIQKINGEYCEFFDLPATATGGMVWLWIVIVIILLIVIAAVVFWIRKKQASAGDAEDDEDPKLEAHQIPGAEDADDEFDVQNEQQTPDEKSPMIKQDEQQSST